MPLCAKADTRGAADLVARLTVYEYGPQLTARSAPAIPRLGLTGYYWGLNMVHGITNPVTGGVLCIGDKCPTIFPAGAGQGASFNATAWRVLGETASIEMRALNNLNWGPAARPGVGLDALVSWGPTINLQRDPRWGRNQETPSSDPFVLSQYAVAVTRGMQVTRAAVWHSRMLYVYVCRRERTRGICGWGRR